MSARRIVFGGLSAIALGVAFAACDSDVPKAAAPNATSAANSQLSETRNDFIAVRLSIVDAAGDSKTPFYQSEFQMPLRAKSSPLPILPSELPPSDISYLVQCRVTDFSLASLTPDEAHTLRILLGMKTILYGVERDANNASHYFVTLGGLPVREIQAATREQMFHEVVAWLREELPRRISEYISNGRIALANPPLRQPQRVE